MNKYIEYRGLTGMARRIRYQWEVKDGYVSER